MSRKSLILCFSALAVLLLGLGVAIAPRKAFERIEVINLFHSVDAPSTVV